MKEQMFVSSVLEMCKAKSVQEVDRKDLGERHVRLIKELLTEEDDILLARLIKTADANKEPVHLSGDSPEYLSSSFCFMGRKARILLCRIIGSQGHEIEFTSDGIIVSPHKNRIVACKAS